MKTGNDRLDALIQAVFRFNLLNKLPRTGFLMRGVDHPESIGGHCFSSSVLACLLIPELRAEGYEIDGEKLLSMVILHESGEIVLGDIPAPAAAFFGKEGKAKAERDAGMAVLAAHPERADAIDEFEDGKSLEARIARGIDKLQMMMMVLVYESEHKGHLDEFWGWSGNFPRTDVPFIDALFARIRESRGTASLDYRGLVPKS